jgi:hypothetical protein
LVAKAMQRPCVPRGLTLLIFVCNKNHKYEAFFNTRATTVKPQSTQGRKRIDNIFNKKFLADISL